MKRLIGNVGSYSFDASAKTITITGVTLILDNFILITNITDNIIIYNFGKDGYGGSYVGGVLTLEYDTTSMDDLDDLQIWVEIQKFPPHYDQQVINEANPLDVLITYKLNSATVATKEIVTAGTTTTITETIV